MRNQHQKIQRVVGWVIQKLIEQSTVGFKDVLVICVRIRRGVNFYWFHSIFMSASLQLLLNLNNYQNPYPTIHFIKFFKNKYFNAIIKFIQSILTSSRMQLIEEGRVG